MKRCSEPEIECHLRASTPTPARSERSACTRPRAHRCAPGMAHDEHRCPGRPSRAPRKRSPNDGAGGIRLHATSGRGSALSSSGTVSRETSFRPAGDTAHGDDGNHKKARGSSCSREQYVKPRMNFPRNHANRIRRPRPLGGRYRNGACRHDLLLCGDTENVGPLCQAPFHVRHHQTATLCELSTDYSSQESPQSSVARTRPRPYACVTFRSHPLPQTGAGITAPRSEGRASPFHVKHHWKASTPSVSPQRLETQRHWSIHDDALREAARVVPTDS